MAELEGSVRGSTPRLHRFDRWLYRGGRPNRVARVLNRFWSGVQASGLILPHRLASLQVAGRRTGRIIRLPVVITDYQGGRYLVAMLGDNTNWVRNVRAAGGHAKLRHGRTETVRLEEVEPAERAPILRRYLAIAPGARAHVPVDRHAPSERFERIAARYPVFRITTEHGSAE